MNCEWSCASSSQWVTTQQKQSALIVPGELFSVSGLFNLSAHPVLTAYNLAEDIFYVMLGRPVFNEDGKVVDIVPIASYPIQPGEPEHISIETDLSNTPAALVLTCDSGNCHGSASLF